MARLNKAQQIRKKLYSDFRYYAPRALKIRPKNPKAGAGIIPLHINRAQQIFLETIWAQWEATGKIRAIVLKGRQQGMSTLIEGLLYWYVSQRRGMRGMVVAHKGDSTNALFTMTNRYHNEAPEFLRPHTKYSSRKELSFDKMDSSITVGTAGSDGLGRGETIQYLHASELSFWPKGKAEEVWSGLMDTMPPAEGSIAIVESTAFGNTGVFYDLWQGALKGLNEFLPVFIPWVVQAEYRIRAPDGFERTHAEETYCEKYENRFGSKPWFEPICDDQLQWRRMKIGEKGLGKFEQEYPLDDDEAFQSSGMQVFLPEHVNRLIEAKEPLLSTKLLIGDKWEEGRSGGLKIYRKHEYGETYYIGADVGHGISTARKNADWSVAVVLDSKMRQVAQIRVRILPGDFARWLYHLGEFYNQALLVVENAGPGYHVCQKLSRDYVYPAFWTEEVYDKVNEEYTMKLGFTTSVRSKPMIINNLRDVIASGELKINDPDTLSELRTYIVTDTGKYEADGANHDDTVMALAFAAHIHEGKNKPVTDYETLDFDQGMNDPDDHMYSTTIGDEPNNDSDLMGSW